MPQPPRYVLFLSLVWLCGVPDLTAAAEAVDYERHIGPLLKQRCVKCHGPARSEGGLNLSTGMHLARGGDSGNAVSPGNLAESQLWQRIASGEMPPNEPLSSDEQERIGAWIAIGAPGLPSQDSDESGEHWAFRPLRLPHLPVVRDATRVKSGIDRFVQFELEKRGLGIGPEADRATLIRRVCYDLTGLPPSPADMAAFVADAADDAYRRMVDRYLASPRYGEHAGKHWLDAAGYADSNGYFDADTVRPLAFRYRDYVIRSLNSDKPFDRFLREQLAGDEFSGYAAGVRVTPEIVEQLEATHFLRNAQDGTGESDGNPQEVRQDRRAVLEGAIEIMGSVLFGLTLQCAKCHDHKFEPVTQRDYLSLIAVLTPAYNLDNWLVPNDRFVYAALPAELAAFAAARKQGKLSELDRPGKIAAVLDIVPVAAELSLPIPGMPEGKGPKIGPAGLGVLAEPDNTFAVRQRTAGAVSSGSRLALAQWLTRPQSRPAALVARLQVNRIWQQHFGQGLSTTPSNFGFSGNAPSHPELLEWLASQLVRSGWSTKSVHRLILTSAAYWQSSRFDSAAQALDPDNRLAWRMPQRRLSAEAIRDALLAVSGDLDTRMGGPAIPVVQTGEGEVVVHDTAPGGRRRSVYLQQRRSQMPTLLSVFDAPSLVTNCVERPPSTVPLQSLALLNSEFVLSRGGGFARRLAQEAGPASDARVVLAFRLAYGRQPDLDELKASLQFVKNQTLHYSGQSPNPQQRAWADFCHTLLASNEFLYLD